MMRSIPPPAPQAAPNQINLHIDLDKIAGIAFLGLRRSMVFMGFGVNAADNDEFLEFDIPGPLTMRFVSEGATPEQIKEMKRHFRVWVIASALRDLLEAISIALTEFYLVVRITADKSIQPQNFDDVRKEVSFKSIPDKLARLSELGMKPVYDAHFFGLTKVRNCLAHRMGLITDSDCNDGDNLTVTWRSFDVELHTESGERFNILDIIGKRLENPGTIVITPADRTRSFRKGSTIDLSHTELAEIGMMTNNAINHFRAETARLAQAHGIKVIQLPEAKSEAQPPDQTS